MFFWPKKKAKKALFDSNLKGKGLHDKIDVPVAMMVPMVAMMMADTHRHEAEIECIHSICTSSPIFLNPSRRHIDSWIADAQQFIRDEGGDEKAIRSARSVLTGPLTQTAFAFSVKVLFADEKVKPTEKVKAEQLSNWLELDNALAGDIIKVISILRHGREA